MGGGQSVRQGEKLIWLPYFRFLVLLGWVCNWVFLGKIADIERAFLKVMRISYVALSWNEFPGRDKKKERVLLAY